MVDCQNYESKQRDDDKMTEVEEIDYQPLAYLFFYSLLIVIDKTTIKIF
jgi:hypothetical protein